MDNPSLNQLLQWSVKNTAADESQSQADTQAVDNESSRGFNSEAFATLLGGPSDADRMRDAMTAIRMPELDLPNKLIAFDNFEQLIENIDNANNMENLGLWMPLIGQLDSSEPDLRRMAAWCIGTAVQNNVRAQERCLAAGTIPKLVELALEDSNLATRKKVIMALSSEIRNYQPGVDTALAALPAGFIGAMKIDAGDMEAVDIITDKLRASLKPATTST